MSDTVVVLSRIFRESSQWKILGEKFRLVWLSGLTREALRDTGGLDPLSITGAILGDHICSGREMDLFPKLKTIARPGAGYNAIDVSAARERGIVVTRVSSVHVGPVSDYALLLLGCLQMRVVQSHCMLVHNGDWSGSRLRNGTLGELRIGIVGLGGIGRALARKLFLLGVETIAWNRSDREGVRRTIDECGVERMESIADLARVSDAVVLCLSLDAGTEGIYDKVTIDQMKEGAFFVNVGRGQLVDEDALVLALEEGRIGGVALDVFASEPPTDIESFKRLRQLALGGGKNVILTGHIANLGVGTAEMTATFVTRNITAVLEGHPENAEVIPSV